jgi:hypothetical protein
VIKHPLFLTELRLFPGNFCKFLQVIGISKEEDPRSLGIIQTAKEGFDDIEKVGIFKKILTNLSLSKRLKVI